MELMLLGVLAATVLLGFYLLYRRTAAQPATDLVGEIGGLQRELSRIVSAQAELKEELHRGREASIQELAHATLGIRGEIGQAQRALAEVKALEQGRARQMDQASESLRRLEAVVAGSGSRGTAGENILARALAQLPPDVLEINVAFGNKVVEYALRLPGGRFLPIDSKWTSVAALDRLSTTEDAEERRKLLDQIVRDVRSRVREMGKYLDPERTLSLALLAVPDAVYAASAEAHGDGYRNGVLVVPYSLALPYVLALYRLVVRFGSAVDTDQLAARLQGLNETLRTIDEEIEGRLSKGLVQVQNARDSLRDHTCDALRSTARLLKEAESPFEVTLPTPVAEVPQLTDR